MFVREEDLEILSRYAGGQDTGQLLRAGASPFPAHNFCQKRGESQGAAVLVTYTSCETTFVCEKPVNGRGLPAVI